MSTLQMTVNSDAAGNLSYDHPPGCSAVELGKGGVLQINLGAGFKGVSQFDQLVLQYSGKAYTLDVTKKPVQPVEAAFPNGVLMLLYNNLRRNLYIRNDGNDPTVGEDDLQFNVSISDAAGQHTLDPEIRVRSGTSNGTATWVPDTGSPAELPDVVVRKSSPTSTHDA